MERTLGVASLKLISSCFTTASAPPRPTSTLSPLNRTPSPFSFNPSPDAFLAVVMGEATSADGAEPLT